MLEWIREENHAALLRVYHTYRMADDILMLGNTSSNSDFDLLWPTSLVTLECEVDQFDPS